MTETLKSNLMAALADADYSSYIPATPVSSFIIATDERSALAGDSVYKIASPIPQDGRGTCYRAEWVERFVEKITRDPDTDEPTGGGASVTSIEILHRGVFRPMVTISGTGTGAVAVAVMSAGGAVASITILDPGTGYTEPPEITLDGDATATATINADTTSPNYGQITAISVTAGGDYLPDITLSAPAPGGTQAEATATLDPQGGLASVSVTEAGAYYETITATAGDAVLFVHYGTETGRCYKWDGVKPEDYDPEDPETYPESEEFTLEVPEEEGEVTFELKRYVCDCSNCP